MPSEHEQLHEVRLPGHTSTAAAHDSPVEHDPEGSPLSDVTTVDPSAASGSWQASVMSPMGRHEPVQVEAEASGVADDPAEDDAATDEGVVLSPEQPPSVALQARAVPRKTRRHVAQTVRRRIFATVARG
jgi:hypothetical protein